MAFPCLTGVKKGKRVQRKCPWFDVFNPSHTGSMSKHGGEKCPIALPKKVQISETCAGELVLPLASQLRDSQVVQKSLRLSKPQSLLNYSGKPAISFDRFFDRRSGCRWPAAHVAEICRGNLAEWMAPGSQAIWRLG